MGVGMLRRYHTQAPEHVNEPVDQDAIGGDGTPEPPAGNASQADWADWVIANVDGVDEATVRAMKRDELREQYGPKAE